MKLRDLFGVAIAILICEAAGIIGSFFTTPSLPTWYAALTKGSLNPPDWVFAPVWTILFALMGIAAYMVWKKRANHANAKIALGVFAVQLALNTLWSYVFFGLQSPGAAFVEIIFLWLAIAATIWIFARVSKPAAWLLVPYIAWVSFASYLNYTLWILNI